ncbi:MAG: UTP--glucose-1-phosphate uridylyltransferase GalU [Sedimenticola sp.]|nr:UTP--glucose-1-phosphate uridylyltransferase GalU [Sedimenticola sp.]MCW8920816.1 UTP--glucose-1-phosphate uridylyltransferase GalU [Sedimenticola sp.]MCW8946894.1 UTP--glucose-1-phosphate uridylyltransferase GalU [Sedimenticola sp.]MCW8949642.1 UTP--glucose-1-phosphate uridylyltransferase GalU [Sedimenticola sp.]MCW8976754.1 UTP--glucose-1-phosphate uridylyltransferase GalU [Sedimenticola sp.]
MAQRKISKAVFPVGGLGTRFLPATKAIPKEMLPVVDKPLIQYAVEEAVAAGIDMLIFITGRNKTAITDHFDKAYELEHQLEIKGKDAILEVVRNIVPRHVDCIYIRQNEALGLGHAVLCAKKAIGDEPFAVLLADDLIDGRNTSCLAQMTDVFDRTGESVIAVERVSHDMTDQYGIVEVEDEISNPARIKSIVEKPRPDLAPSNLGVVGRYILTPEIFSLLEHTGEGSGGEIQLTDAISELLKQQSINAFQFNGIRYDCGSRAGFLRANIEYAAKDQELKELLVSFVADLKQRPDN